MCPCGTGNSNCSMDLVNPTSVVFLNASFLKEVFINKNYIPIYFLLTSFASPYHSNFLMSYTPLQLFA